MTFLRGLPEDPCAGAESDLVLGPGSLGPCFQELTSFPYCF